MCTIIDSFYLLGDLKNHNKTYYFPIEKEIGLVESEFENHYKLCWHCVGHQDNENLSEPQKELLLWNLKLGFIMYHIQEMMRGQNMEELSGIITVLPPVINTK